MSDGSTIKKRDIWDKFGAISVFLSTVVIGAAGLIINGSISEREGLRAKEMQEEQQRIAKVQTLETFMPHLSGNKESREAAIFAITVLGYPELAVRLNQLKQEDQKTNDAIMRSAPASISAELFTPTHAQISIDKEIGWVYLGDYSPQTNKWNTRYLNFDEQEKPENLVEKIFDVRKETGAINIRFGMPTESGEFQAVIKTFQPGHKLRILEIKQWLTTGYTWARVVYSK